MDKTVSLAKSTPLILGIIFGGMFASYMFTGMFTETAIGRPSSTAALGLIFAPIFSLIIAGIGALLGLVPMFILLKRGERDRIKKSKLVRNAFILTILLSVAAGGVAFIQVVANEKRNSPHILSNNGNFIITAYSESDIPSVAAHPSLVWEFGNKNIAPTAWLGNQYIFNVNNSTSMQLITGSSTVATYNFSDYTYLTEISTLPITTSKNVDYLLVLVKLRATSFRSMLLIYDKDFNLVHENLVRRCGRTQYIGVTNDIEGGAFVINLCEPFTINVNI
jgi:hypothetical protein